MRAHGTYRNSPAVSWRFWTPIPYGTRVIVEAALGEHQAAIRSLEQAYADHSVWLSWLEVEPAFDVLRSDTAFVSLLARIGFRDSRAATVSTLILDGVRIQVTDQEADRAFRRTTASRAADLEPFLRRMRRIKLDAIGR
jgi:hypothetical protein